MYIISAPASPVLGFLVDKTGKNVIWVLIAVVTTLAAHMMLAFTFWNPWIAMVMALASFTLLLLCRTSVSINTDCIPTRSPVCTGRLLLLTGLCPLANGGLCGSRASAGDSLWFVSTCRLVMFREHTHRFEPYPCYLSISMQSIQNLGLALIAMVAGTILDTRGYLILEVFFCTCVCSE